VIRTGEERGWRLGEKRYHADDHAVGHAWVDDLLMDCSRTERLAPTRVARGT
jgi:hypothetical protein